LISVNMVSPILSQYWKGDNSVAVYSIRVIIMVKGTLVGSALSVALIMHSGLTPAEDQQPIQQNTQPQQTVLGKDLMTGQERAEHHASMQAAETQQERDQLRREQHERMKQRAEGQGLSIPDEPPAKSGGTGDHMGH
jgi:hypothetical protein